MRKVIIFLLLLGALGYGAYRVYWERFALVQDPNSLVLYGNVDIRQVDLAFKDSERIRAVFVEEGDTVVKGQVLAELETERLRANVEATRASVDAQKFVLEELKNGTRPEEIKQTIAAEAQAQAELVVSERTYRRQTRLLQRGANTQQDVDDARAAYDVARARLKAAREARILAQKGPRWETIRSAQATLKNLQAQLVALQVQLEESKLRAPVDAVVRNRNLEPGDMASAQKPVFTLGIMDPKWIRTYIPEDKLGRIKPGSKGYAVVDSWPDKHYEGWVGFISSTAEFTPRSVETPELRTSLVYEVRFNVHDPDDDLRLGMPATVHCDLSAQNTLQAPGAEKK